MAQSQKTIAEGITIIKEALVDRKQVIKVRNDRDCQIIVAVDISGSRAVSIAQSPLAAYIEVTVPSRETAELATLRLGEDWNIVTKYKVSLRPPESEAFARQLNAERRTMIGLSGLCLDFIRKVGLAAMSDEELRQRGISNFVDPYFPPENESVFRGADAGNLTVAPHWRRPEQFFSSEFTILPADIEPSDLKPGQLSDNWLVSGLRAISERPHLLRRLFPSPSKSDCGIYRLRLCKDGEWRIVTVDDYFPCYPNLAPMFSRSHANELWVLLVEKAFAKIVGGYMRLREGFLSEALSDLTGCPTLTFDFELLGSDESLWLPLSRAAHRHAIILATAQEGDTARSDRYSGFIPGRGYTVLGAKEAFDRRLVNVRSESDFPEWDGDWSEKSPLWTSELRSVFDSSDCAFWMAFSDFQQTFTRISVCFPEPFYEARLKGKFLRVPTSDGRSFVLSKHYYCFSLEEQTRIFVGIHQEDKRIYGAETRRAYLDIGFFLFRREAEGEVKLVRFEGMKVDREVVAELDLQPGDYIIVPRTSGCGLREPMNVQSKATPLLTTSRLTPLAESTFRDLFRKFDTMLSGDLSQFDLRALYDVLGLNLSDADFQHIKETFSCTRDGLTIEGFLDLIEKMIADRGEEFMRAALLKAGYNSDLYSIKSRVFMLVIHSERQTNVEVRENVKSNLTNIGWVQHVTENGERKRELDAGTFYGFREAYYEHSIGTYVFSSKCPRPLRVTVDVSGSQGVALSTQTDVHRLTLEPHSAGVVFHFQFLGGNVLFKPRIDVVPL